MMCPNCAQNSTDAEFCSECGAAMAMAAVTVQPELVVCPVCGEARPGASARFCDTCRYDFVERTPFSASPSLPKAAQVPRWTLQALVDLSLRRAEDPMPSDEQEKSFLLDLPEQLIGRGSDAEGIHPDIVIADPGISRRHARLLVGPDGALSVVDLGSMNGSKLNAVRLEPNMPTALKAGDELTLGCWTRLKVQTR